MAHDFMEHVLLTVSSKVRKSVCVPLLIPLSRRFTEGSHDLQQGVEVEATRYFIGGAVSPHFKITVNPFVKLDNVFILPYFKVNVLYFAHVSVNCAGSQGKSCSSAQEYQ